MTRYAQKPGKRKGWKLDRSGPINDGWVYYNKALGVAVMPLTGDRRRRWFISFGLSFAEDRRGNVRLFWTPEGAMRVAEQLGRAA